MENNKILEALQIQPLSEEEKAKRGILARYWGPIATTKERTRNERLYNKELWEAALKDELFLEKVANKSLFLELGHPMDREWTDMTKVCACIPEVPKIVDGDLYAYVDILNTPNGKILKTLCDYGFIPGISSRGSGDVDYNQTVDPETFFLETFDIVQIPAVKKARLSVCESLNTKNIKLRKALNESLSNATDEEKIIMKETLKNLNIDSNELVETKFSNIPHREIPEELEENMNLKEDADNIEDTTELEVTGNESSIEDNSEVSENTDSADGVDEADTVEEEAAEETNSNDSNDSEFVSEELDGITISDFVNELQKIDENSPLEISLEKTDSEYIITISAADDKNATKFETAFSINEIDTDTDSNINNSDANTSEDAVLDTENTEISTEVDDSDDTDVLESLKKTIRENDSLKKHCAELEAKQADIDNSATLKEELEKYKRAFKRTSIIASEKKAIEEQVASLKEQLSQKDRQITSLKTKVTQINQLNESLDTSSKDNLNKVKKELEGALNKAEETNKKLQEQMEQNKKVLNVAKSYKAKYLESLEKYIISKSKMLALRPSELKNRLPENYSIEDIDKVCNEILSESINISRLPFAHGTKNKVTIKEAKSVISKEGYEIDDSLLELAGLK